MRSRHVPLISLDAGQFRRLIDYGRIEANDIMIDGLMRQVEIVITFNPKDIPAARPPRQRPLDPPEAREFLPVRKGSRR
jgi:hypothetical protein